MSDQTEDRDGTAAEVTEAAAGQQTATWSAPAAGPRWSEIASEATPAGSSEAGPAAQPVHPAPPAPEAGRARRPSSLRSDAASGEVPRRRLAPPSFPNRGSDAASATTTTGVPDSQGAVSEAPQTGRSGQVADSTASLIERIPLAELQTLVKKRPEVGVGIAFAGGLVIATILKRLGRR